MIQVAGVWECTIGTLRGRCQDLRLVDGCVLTSSLSLYIAESWTTAEGWDPLGRGRGRQGERERPDFAKFRNLQHLYPSQALERQSGSRPVQLRARNRADANRCCCVWLQDAGEKALAALAAGKAGNYLQVGVSSVKEFAVMQRSKQPHFGSCKLLLCTLEFQVKHHGQLYLRLAPLFASVCIL